MSGQVRRRTLGGVGVVVAALLIAVVAIWSNGGVGGPEQSPSSSDPFSQATLTNELTQPASSDPNGTGPIVEPTIPGGLYVEPDVVDRPGVPIELYDKYWAAARQVGQVGTTARIVLPEDEWILGADSGMVATYQIDRPKLDELGVVEPILGTGGVTIVVRDVRFGEVVRTLVSPIAPSDGLITGSLLFWTGRSLPLDNETRVDGGVWAIDFTDPQASPTAIFEPSDLAETYGKHAVRGLLHLTDRGRAVTTLIESDSSFATDVIDVEQMAPQTTLAGVYALELVAGKALATQPHQFTGPGKPDGLWLIDIESGQQVGPKVEADRAYRSMIGDSEIFASFARGGSAVVATIDLSTGKARDILALKDQPLSLSPRLSTSDVLVFLRDEDPIFDDQGRVQLAISLLDPRDGDLQLDAFTIGNP